MLGLFLAVLIRHAQLITFLEVVFWFWAAGYMLDELVGFTEQGFSLYLASFWNTFDLGILLILIIHLCLRIYGVVMPDIRKHAVAKMAYDVLAADAVLLFPRLFSVLDHYRYFSQLLIAFRMMASDLMAIFVLIIISCSGFFVALTLSFGNDDYDTPGSVAYALLQILMGFTPAAWDRWSGYNALGKTILTLFLFICHFLVVTILITVLTNSFMAIVQNANEEHQFVFAVNTISMVKSDALFSYVAPANIIAWILTPLRFFVPSRRYVKVNRVVIKVTHFPILFLIYVYEKFILRPSVVDTIELIEPRGRPTRGKLFRQTSHRLAREPSIATFRQDRALEQVFRKPFPGTVRGTLVSQERRKTSNVVNNWMQDMNESVISPPPEQDRRIVDRLERPRLVNHRSRLSSTGRDFSRVPRSVASDPEDFAANAGCLPPRPRRLDTIEATSLHVIDVAQHTDGDGDDELISTDNEDEDKVTLDPRPSMTGLNQTDFTPHTVKRGDYFSLRSTPKTKTPQRSGSLVSSSRPNPDPDIGQTGSGHQLPPTVTPKGRQPVHARNLSAATIVFNPLAGSTEPSAFQDNGRSLTAGARSAGNNSTLARSGVMTPVSTTALAHLGRRSPKKTNPGLARARPTMSRKDEAFQSAPDLTGMIMMKGHGRDVKPRPRSFLGLDIGSDIGDNKAIGGGYVGAIPASLATQMDYVTGGLRRYQSQGEGQDVLSRLMLARMSTLEDGLREVVHEMRTHLRRDPSPERSHHTSLKGTGSRPGKSKEESDQENQSDGSLPDKTTRSPAKHKFTTSKHGYDE